MKSKSKRPGFKDYRAALVELKKKKAAGLPHLIVFHGSSEFLLGEAIRVLRKTWNSADGSSVRSLEAENVDADTMAAIWEQASLFEPATLYLMRRVEQAKGLPKQLAGIPVLDSPNHVCLVYQGGSLPAALRKECDRLGAFYVPCIEPAPWERQSFAGELAQSRGVKLSSDAVQTVLDAVGEDLTKLKNEIEKLALVFADGSDPLQPDDIAPHLGMLREDHAFRLDRYLLGGERAKAEALLFDLLERGEPALAVTGLLARHCRNAVQIEAQVGSGASPRDAASELRLPFGVVKQYAEAVRGKGPRPFLRALDACREADFALKSGRMESRLLLGKVLDELASPRRSRH